VLASNYFLMTLIRISITQGVTLVSYNFSPVEALEFTPSSLILVPLICGLENYGIIDSALPTRRFLIVDLIEQGHLLIVGGPVIFKFFGVH
jgi:hypothetical protein